jgi:uncharacterized membrane protein (UPF0127 family)
MVQQKVSFNYQRKKFSLSVHKCNFIDKIFGLIIYRRQALLFDFKKEKNISIHSLFCPKFLAIWLDKQNKIIEIQLIKPWRFSILPSRKFKKLIEIPFTQKYFSFISKILETPSVSRKI